ncbi:MAG: GTP cyclohydrolase FolE2, partial [Bdellovibrionia bacterium]
MTDTKKMPDVALESATYALPLQWVGMKNIELPIQLTTQAGALTVPAKVRAQVSLDQSPSRGIHMSRLFLEVQKLSEKPLTAENLQLAVAQFLETHKDLSSKAVLEIEFELPLKRKALKSDNSAWRTYPVKLSAQNEWGVISTFCEVQITYSSTCPASAALARQLIQENFLENYRGDLSIDAVSSWLSSQQGINATPHAQRSVGRVKAEFAGELPIENLIELTEEALQTPVQGAVKRVDEQEFALRNGQNLMFCEDAARRVGQALEN